ncbi:hypothetical protein BDW72DRAFT_179191 [Aspergillus terricola var. indicus]
MKLTLNSLLALAPLLGLSQAADCTAPNQQVFSQAAVEMMWSIRAWLCPNAWNQWIIAYPDGAWCDAGGGIVSAFYGSWEIRGMQSEQQCWVSLPFLHLLSNVFCLDWGLLMRAGYNRGNHQPMHVVRLCEHKLQRWNLVVRRYLGWRLVLGG